MDIQWDVSFFIARMVFNLPALRPSVTKRKLTLVMATLTVIFHFQILQSYFLIFSISCGFLLKADNPLANVVTFFVSKAG